MHPRPQSLEHTGNDLACEDELVLVERAKEDRREFGRLYDLHARAVLDFLMRRTGHAHVSEDLASDVFVRALGSLRAFRTRGVPFRHWLLRIAANLASNWRRRQRSSPRAAAEAELEALAARENDETRFEHVRAALDAIPERCATLLVLHHVEGLGVRELAELYSEPFGTIQSRLHRGRERLRTAIQARSDPR